MSYFPHAFKKVFVGNTFVTSGKTEALTAGQFGFFNANTWTAIASGSAGVSVNPKYVLAMGSSHSVDKVGSHGGYKESVKSQIIHPGNVHRFWKVGGTTAQSQIIMLGWDGDNDNTVPQFVCGKNYNLRIDLKGAAALRYLGQNLYRTFSAFSGCCADENIEPVRVDPAVVLLEFAKQINADPLYSNFVLAEVVTGDGVDSDDEWDVIDADTYTVLTETVDIEANIVGLRLTVAYVDTKFGECSFEPTDYYDVEPLIITSAQLVDESGDACPEFTQLTFTEVQSPRMPNGTGEMVLREMIMFNNYRQEIYQTDPRMREAEDMAGLFTSISRSGVYDSYYILHSVPRHQNPSGVYDNDLYLIHLYVPDNTNMTGFETWMQTSLDSAGNGVKLETI